MILKADDVLLHFNEHKAEVESMVANGDYDYIRVILDNLVVKLEDNSENYNADAIERLKDFILLLPDDIAFSLLKDLALNKDICERLFLKYSSIFDILKKVRCVSENISG